ncbi:MAG: hypothetical protein DRJ42_03960 [Deltaproteobacteria bacterium]|nr:MAG: hypothetical protein DRJ42_03960 [Deltaproteobacteria bacterium]
MGLSERLGRALAVGAIALLTSCPGDPTGDAAVDASTDATQDTSDAADTGNDGPLDSALDGDSGTGSWNTIAGFPDGCNEWTEDEALIGRFDETPCTGMATGCTKLVPSWPDGENLYLAASRNGIHDGSRGLFSVRHYLDDDQVVTAIFSENGVPRGGVRGKFPTEFDGSCFMTGIAPGRRGDVVFGVLEDNDQYLGAVSTETGGEPRLIRVLREEESYLNAIGTFRPTEMGIVLDLFPAGFIYQLAWADGALTSLGSPPADPGQDIISDFYASAVFFTFWDFWQQVRVAVPGDANRILIAPTDAAAAILRTDGTSLYWLQGYGPTSVYDFERIEIWTAPYTTSRDDLAPRRIAVTPLTKLSDDFYAGHGYAGVALTASRLRLYRLTDGAETTIDTPVGTTLQRGGVLWLGPEEIAIASGPRAALDGLPYTTHIRRIRYDALTWE